MEIENTNHSASMISISLQFVYLKLLQQYFLRQFIGRAGPVVYTTYKVEYKKYYITTSTRKFYESSNTYAVVALQIKM